MDRFDAQVQALRDRNIALEQRVKVHERLLRALAERGRAALRPGDARAFALAAPLLAEEFPGREIFFTSWVVDRCAARPALRDALRPVAGEPLSAKKVGRFLARCAGHPAGELRLIRCGTASGSALFLFAPADDLEILLGL